ncbi:MAG: leucine-rich repeat domain-containing protein [Verrucomicrobiota bacterium]
MRFRLNLSILLILATPMMARAGFSYQFINDGTEIEITGLGSTVGSAISIPSLIENKPVTSIADFAFFNERQITSATIPGTVKTIGASSFEHCSVLVDVFIGDGVELIENSAFRRCTELSSISIPDSVTSIGEFAFNQCASLSSVSLPANNTAIGQSAFRSCPGLTDIAIPDGTTSIGSRSFFDCKNLVTASIPGSVAIIGGSAFSACDKLISINVAPENQTYSDLDGVLFDSTFTTIIALPGGFSGDYTIPSSVDTIGEAAFTFCDNVTSIFIPFNTSITGANPFGSCDSLDTIVTEESHPSLRSIDGVLFDNTESTLIAFPGGRSGHYSIPQGVSTIAPRAFYISLDLESVSIPEGITSIQSHAFYRCQGLQTIFLPESLTSIDEWAFFRCDQVRTITFPAALAAIGENAFFLCDSLVSAEFSGDAPALGSDVFKDSADAFSVYYYESAVGFDLAPWQIYPSVILPSGISPFSAWALIQFNGTDHHENERSPAADPDNDGKDNLSEYGFGCDPTRPDHRQPLSASLGASGTSFDVSFPINERATDLTLKIQTSTTGADWTQSTSFVPQGSGLPPLRNGSEETASISVTDQYNGTFVVSERFQTSLPRLVVRVTADLR